MIAVIGVIVSDNRNAYSTQSVMQPTLKDLASKHDVEVGNFAIPSRYNEPEYREILTKQFDFVLMDNQPNWQFTDHALRPTATDYDFEKLDEVVAFAKEHNMPVQAHHFMWGDEKWLPDWLKNGNYTKEQLYAIMADHIQKVGSRYSGQVREWTVVNEAFTRQQHLYGLHDWWADHTGGIEYIDHAFIEARKADPKAVLILNDFNNESINQTSDAMYAYIKSARERGIPIDAIGMQMHIDGTHPPKKDEVIANMQRFKDLGVGVYVTEFDVNINDIPTSETDRQKIQGEIYYEMARACIESNACKSFAILGITDKETWYNYMGVGESQPLPFDDRYGPKPAFYRLRDAFSE